MFLQGACGFNCRAGTGYPSSGLGGRLVPRSHGAPITWVPRSSRAVPRSGPRAQAGLDMTRRVPPPGERRGRHRTHTGHLRSRSDNGPVDVIPARALLTGPPPATTAPGWGTHGIGRDPRHAIPRLKHHHLPTRAAPSRPGRGPYRKPPMPCHLPVAPGVLTRAGFPHAGRLLWKSPVASRRSSASDGRSSATRGRGPSGTAHQLQDRGPGQARQTLSCGTGARRTHTVDLRKPPSPVDSGSWRPPSSVKRSTITPGGRPTGHAACP